MTLDDTFHIFRAAVTDFDGVTVEDLIELMVLREMLIDQLKELSGDFGFYVLVVRRIEPCDVAFTIFWLVVCLVSWVVRKFDIITTALLHYFHIFFTFHLFATLVMTKSTFSLTLYGLVPIRYKPRRG